MLLVVNIKTTFLYDMMGTGYFPGVELPGHGIYHPPPSSTKVKERVELYLFFPSGSSQPVLE